MADLWSIISANYKTVGLTVPSKTPYVAVDPNLYEGSWTGKYGKKAVNTRGTYKVDQEVLKKLSDLESENESLMEQNKSLRRALDTLDLQWKATIQSRNSLREQLKELGIEPRA